jgi:hypothetical protein
MAVASANPPPPIAAQPFCSTKNFVYDYFDVHNVRLYLGLVGHNRLVVHDTKGKYQKYTIFLKVKKYTMFQKFYKSILCRQMALAVTPLLSTTLAGRTLVPMAMAANPTLTTNGYGGMATWHLGATILLPSQLLAHIVTKIFLIENIFSNN